METHKHKDLIIEWACGAEIEYLELSGWYGVISPTWDADTQYRIKPMKKPSYVKTFLQRGINNTIICDFLTLLAATNKDVEVTLNGETDRIIKVEMK